MIWTQTRLERLAADALRGRKFLVVSNREPYMHVADHGRIAHRQHRSPAEVKHECIAVLLPPFLQLQVELVARDLAYTVFVAAAGTHRNCV